MHTPPYRVTPTSIVIVIDGITHTLTAESHRNYDAIREAIKVKDFDTVKDLINVSQNIIKFGQGKITVKDGVVFYGDYALHNTLTRRLLEQMDEGFDVEPMVKFLENLMQNPSKRAVDELYDFMEACDLPITDDGHFVAYKKVRADYKDIYTGKVDNKIGSKPSMPRNMVDEDKARTCSQGLHFCAQSYLQYYSSHDANTDHVMIVKINPKDVVAIPADYENAKGRACEYEVIGEVDRSNVKFYEKSVYQTTNASDYADDVGDDFEEDGVFYELHFVDEHGEEEYAEDAISLYDAKVQAKAAMDMDASIRGVKIYNSETGEVVKEYTNDIPPWAEGCVTTMKVTPGVKIDSLKDKSPATVCREAGVIVNNRVKVVTDSSGNVFVIRWDEDIKPHWTVVEKSYDTKSVRPLLKAFKDDLAADERLAQFGASMNQHQTHQAPSSDVGDAMVGEDQGVISAPMQVWPSPGGLWRRPSAPTSMPSTSTQQKGVSPDVVFSKSQAAAILGVNQQQLETMLDEGTKIVRDGFNVRFK